MHVEKNQNHTGQSLRLQIHYFALVKDRFWYSEGNDICKLKEKSTIILNFTSVIYVHITQWLSNRWHNPVVLKHRFSFLTLSGVKGLFGTLQQGAALQLLLFHQHARGKELPIWAYTYTHTWMLCEYRVPIVCSELG